MYARELGPEGPESARGGQKKVLHRNHYVKYHTQWVRKGRHCRCCLAGSGAVGFLSLGAQTPPRVSCGAGLVGVSGWLSRSPVFTSWWDISMFMLYFPSRVSIVIFKGPPVYPTAMFLKAGLLEHLRHSCFGRALWVRIPRPIPDPPERASVLFIMLPPTENLWLLFPPFHLFPSVVTSLERSFLITV